ncbi:hypothetical protein RUM43_004852 [Polyplax serrata]|uniref:Elongator complex protein 6 n=1 Tax=Polyplax serrata TaxID=468196 RepID=A0AAN8XQN5_POLSC
MIDGTISKILSTLHLDENSSHSKFVCIEERDNADGTFIISSIIKDQIEKGNNVLLIMSHNSIGHFHSISQKLGYNLMSLRDSGRIFVVDILEKIANEDFMLSENPLKQLYFDVKEKIDSCKDDRGICVLLENIGNLLLINMSDVLNFVQYLRGLVYNKKNSLCVCSIHNFLGCSDMNTFTKAIKHVADCAVTLSDLTTGRANEVTGHLSVLNRDEKLIQCRTNYHYLLQDKTIYVFAPGSKEHLYRR